MSFTPGGRADKFGNNYESLWVASRFLDVLTERNIRSVTVEAIGEAEQGVDLWVENFDGSLEAEQCKARNNKNDKWTISSLRNVIVNIPVHVTQGNRKSFTLVSPVPFFQLEDLCKEALNSNDPEDYFRAIVSSSKEKKAIFSGFCDALELSADLKRDREKAYTYLKRFKIEFYSSTDKAIEDLKSRAILLFDGKAETIVSLLRTYVLDEQMLGKQVDSKKLHDYLAKNDIHPKTKINDNRLTNEFNRLKEDFNDSIVKVLISNHLINREESSKCFEMLELNDVIILHGESGSGKSGVLYEFVSKLEENDMQCMPIRLDRNIPRGSSKAFGIQLGLPDSPARCLASYSGKKRAVLVLDQLDAIRWTSESSLESIAVCKQMIKEILTYNEFNDGDLKIVVVCRTFDLENDPDISNWLLNRKDGEQFAKVEVKELSEKDIRAVVGEGFSSFTTAQISILKNPQNLYMWNELKGEKYSFVNHADLMRAFWNLKRSKLEKSGVDLDKVDRALDSFVFYMEKKGEISAPERVLEKHSPDVIDSLMSNSVIQKQVGRFSFCHQSYLDYLVASRVLDEIDNGGSVLDWLGEKKGQTLFRRQQLSIFLYLQMKESQADFIRIARQVLFSDAVRFHVKHLVFEVFSQMDDADSDSLLLFDELLELEDFKDHVIKVSASKNPTLVAHMVQNEILANWLKSDNKDQKNDALSIMHSVVEKHPYLIQDLLIESYEKKYISKAGAFSTLSYYFADDTEVLFKFRLQLMNDGLTLKFVDWKNLVSRKPMYALDLIKLLALSEGKQDELECAKCERNIYDHDLKEILKIVDDYYLQTWDLLFDFSMNKLLEHNKKDYHSRYRLFDIEKSYLQRRSHLDSFSDLCIVLMIAAGKKIAENDPTSLISFLGRKSQEKQEIPCNALSLIFLDLPKKCSNFVVEWLLEDDGRLCLGLDFQRSKWMLAGDLLNKFSQQCDIHLFRKIESKLYVFTPADGDFKSYYKSRVEGWRYGYYFPAWGGAQYMLLPCLSESRVSQKTKNLIIVLKRKFDKYPKSRFFFDTNTKGGMIGSKIEPYIDRISDDSWIKIITNEKTTNKHDHSTWEQIDQDTVHVSSHEVFAGSLERAAKKDPKRFCNIFEKLPVNIDIRYISSMLTAFSILQNENVANDGELKEWEKAEIIDIEKFWKKYRFCRNDGNVARSLAWLVKRRSSELWPALIVNDLVELALSHKDPVNKDLNVRKKDETFENASASSLHSTAINSVRGSAIEALGDLLWKNRSHLEVIEENINKLLLDEHPAVLMSIQSIVLPMLNIDKNKALSWFTELSRKDTRTCCTREAVEFFNYMMSTKDERLIEIVRDMVRSDCAEVVELAGEMVTFYTHCYDGIFDQEFQMAKNGNISLRKGVVKALKNLIKNDKYAVDAREIFLVYFNDQEKEIRDIASQIFYDDDLLNSQENLILALSYVESIAFLEGDRHLFNCLENYRGSLVKFSGLIINACIQMLRGDRNSSNYHPLLYEQKKFVLLLIKLYDQAGIDVNLKDKCLDIWDMFFREDVEMTREITNIISK